MHLRELCPLFVDIPSRLAHLTISCCLLVAFHWTTHLYLTSRAVWRLSKILGGEVDIVFLSSKQFSSCLHTLAKLSTQFSQAHILTNLLTLHPHNHLTTFQLYSLSFTFLLVRKVTTLKSTPECFVTSVTPMQFPAKRDAIAKKSLFLRCSVRNKLVFATIDCFH